MISLLPKSTLIFLARQIWKLVIYPLFEKFVDTTPNVYDNKALKLLNEAIEFVCDNIGASLPDVKLSLKK